MTPIAIVLCAADGTVTTHPLKGGSWPGAGHRASVEIDGIRYAVYVDSVRT